MKPNKRIAGSFSIIFHWNVFSLRPFYSRGEGWMQVGLLWLTISFNWRKSL